MERGDTKNSTEILEYLHRHNHIREMYAQIEFFYFIN